MAWACRKGIRSPRAIEHGIWYVRRKRPCRNLHSIPHDWIAELILTTVMQHYILRQSNIGELAAIVVEATVFSSASPSLISLQNAY